MSQGEINRILEPPFSSSELGYIPGGLGSFYAPEFQYKREAEIEARRLDSLSVDDHSPQEVKDWLQPRRSRVREPRRNILTRHNIKSRWQKLGIWNPEWGIPGRDINPQPSDDLSCWNWPWAGPDPPRQFIFDSDGKNVPNPDHAITKVLQPRQGLRRGEHLPVASHPKPQPHPSASDADAFITSRPWFQFYLELQEEGQREHRLSWQQEEYLYRNQPSDHSPIIERWKNRGIWKEEWKPLEQGSSGENLPQIGWKWRHESPSPEPESLTQLESMEFTPSEADELDDLPSPNPSPPPPRIVEIRSPTSGAGGLFGRLPTVEPQEEPVQEPEDTTATRPLSPVPERRRRRHSLVHSPALPLRRSARIAAMRAEQIAIQGQLAAAKGGKAKRGRPRKG